MSQDDSANAFNFLSGLWFFYLAGVFGQLFLCVLLGF